MTWRINVDLPDPEPSEAQVELIEALITKALDDENIEYVEVYAQ